MENIPFSIHKWGNFARDLNSFFNIYPKFFQRPLFPGESTLKKLIFCLHRNYSETFSCKMIFLRFAYIRCMFRNYVTASMRQTGIVFFIENTVGRLVKQWFLNWLSSRLKGQWRAGVWIGVLRHKKVLNRYLLVRIWWVWVP